MSVPDPTPAAGRARFGTTRWSLVLRAGRATGDERRAALEDLCAATWYPLYAWLRRSGHDAHESADLVQGFFAGLLARNDLAQLEAEGGRFRSFLLVALRRHVARERERAQALKRGGGAATHSLDALFDPALAARRYAAEPVDNETPERVYERALATALIARSLAALREEEADAGRAEAFVRLERFLQEGVEAGDYEGVAAELGRTPGAIKLAVHRLRVKWRARLTADVAAQVERPQEVEDELAALLAALQPSERGERW